MGLQIKKLDNGQVRIYSTTKERPEYYDPQAVLKYSQGGGAVGVYYSGRLELDLFPDQVDSYQIGDAGAVVPFSGDVKALMDILGQSFFFPSVAGEAGSDYIETYFYKVDVTNGSTFPFLIHTEEIPLDNAISFEVDYIGFRTDTNGGGRRQTLAKYAANDGGFINVANTANTLLSSTYFITASIVLNGSSLELQIDAPGGDVSYNFWVKIRKINK